MYKTELNFLTQFKLNRNGMILEIKEEFNIMRWAISQLSELDDVHKEMIDKIVVTSLRKLLFENQHTSILLEVCPNFRMPPLQGRVVDGTDKLKMILTPFDFVDDNLWIDVKTWSEQKMAYYEKGVDDLPYGIPIDTFQCAINQLKGIEKSELKNLFCLQTIKYENEDLEVYIRRNPEDDANNDRIFELLSKAGYYNLTVYDFIKHLSDKRGAHIDFAIAPLIKIMNGNSKEQVITAVQNFALQLIYAAKKQIPELIDYWPEMEEIIP